MKIASVVATGLMALGLSAQASDVTTGKLAGLYVDAGPTAPVVLIVSGSSPWTATATTRWAFVLAHQGHFRQGE